MTTRVQTSRFTTTGGRPSSGTRPIGEVFLNFPDKQIGVVDAAQNPLDLIAVRYFSATADYVTGDLVRNGSNLLRAITDITAGAFNAAEWESIDGEAIVVSATAPTTPLTNQLWVDTSLVVDVWKYWNGSAWVEVGTGLVRGVFSDLAALVADTESYADGEVLQTLTEGYRYVAVSSGAHLTKGGGQGLKLLPDAAGVYHALALNESDIGAAVNTLFADLGSYTHVHIGEVAPGTVTLQTTIDMKSSVGSSLVLSGAGSLSTTLTMAGGSSMIGIDAQTQDECVIRDLRIIEEVGSQTCVCMVVGGTSGSIRNCWVGNAKTGIAYCGSGAQFNNIYDEACIHGLLIASRYADFEAGMTAPMVSVASGSFSQVKIHNCGGANDMRKCGLFVTSFKQANISAIANGPFTVGETVTGQASGKTGVIYSSNGVDTLILDQAFDAFTPGETILGASSGATATLGSTNTNSVRGLNFTAIEVTSCQRHGAVIETVIGAQIQGLFKGNGANATSYAAGIEVNEGAQVTVMADLIDNGPQAGGHSGSGFGLYIPSGSNADVTAIGGLWTSSQASDQDYAFRRISGDLTLLGVNLTGNVVGVTNSTADGHIARGCIGLVDSDYPRNAVSAAAAVANNVNGQVIRMDGLAYVLDNTATGADSATNDLGVDGLIPFGVPTAKHFGAVGNGTTDDSAAMQAAFNYCAGGTLIIQPGRYRIVTGVTLSGVGIELIADGAFLIQGADVTVLSITALATDITAVSSIDNADTVDVSDGAAVTTPVASLTFASTPPFAVGDLLKVVSNNTFVNSGLGSQRWGEMARVVAISGNDVFLSKRFITELPGSIAGIRAGRMDESARVTIRGLGFGVDPAGDAGGWDSTLFIMAGLVKPILRDIRIEESYGLAIQARGCAEIDASGIVGGHCHNEPASNRYGYLVQDGSGHGNNWRGLQGHDCRHVYTTWCASSTGDADLHLYGQTVGCQVSDSIGTDCTGTAFDTHQDAVGVSFSNCVAIAAVRGPDAIGGGFQLRGRDCRISDCRSLGTKFGLQILQDYATDATVRAVVDGLISDTILSAVIITGQSGNPVTGVSLRNVMATVRDHTHVIEGSYCSVDIEDCRLRHIGANNDSRIVQADAGGIFKVRDTSIDLDDHTGTNPYLFGVDQDDSAIRVENIDVTGVWRGIFNFNTNDGIGIARTPVRADSTPTNAGAIGGTGGTPTIGVDYVVDDGETISFNYGQLTYSTTGNKDLDLGYRSSPHMFVRCTVTTTGVAIHTITPGLFIGQLLTICSHNISTQNFDVDHNIAGLIALGGADLTLTPGNSMLLWWDGAYWRLASHW